MGIGNEIRAGNGTEKDLIESEHEIPKGSARRK
ncbi:hypothetical protein FHS38_003197, partial [Streptomyces netropsis]|nr:hypothetical protein [Streptomyces netropsis]